MKHTVDTQVLQDILNYLANRPYGEVAALVQSLQNSAKAVVEPPALEPELPIKLVEESVKAE